MSILNYIFNFDLASDALLRRVKRRLFFTVHHGHVASSKIDEGLEEVLAVAAWGSRCVKIQR